MATKPTAKSKPKSVATLTALVEWVGKTRRTITDWSTHPKFPRDDDGGFSPFLTGVWFATHGPGVGKDVDGKVEESKKSRTENLELLRGEKHRREQLKRLQDERKLVPAEFCRVAFATIATKLRRFSERLDAGTAQELVDVIAEIESDTAKWAESNLSEIEEAAS